MTDTAPIEVPIIFSNDGFYKNLSECDAKTDKLKELIGALVLCKRNYTIPFIYAIAHDEEGVRKLSLIHPHGQAKIARFYEKYDQLICEFGGRSSFSIRKPVGIGRSFIGGENNRKNASIDASAVDNIERNPETYFTYRRYNRLYRFFSSEDYIQLEKKYKHMLILDIGKCFDSIYTHSITWAVTDKESAKKSPRARSFGNQFDLVMRSLNYGETSGICIGPEASRLFAEIILAKVDQNLRDRLNQFKLTEKTHFDCRRYVDNYYVFANTRESTSIIQDEIRNALSEYKLYLNEGKTENLERPFYTRKSIVIDRVDVSIQNLENQIFKETDHCGTRLIVPSRIKKRRSLFLSFTREVKAACQAAQAGYDAVASYVISTVDRQITELADSHLQTRKTNGVAIATLDYRQVVLFLLEVGFHYFMLHPTVASSQNLSHAILRTGQHFVDHDPEGFEIAREAIVRWTNQFARSPAVKDLIKRNRIVPIELLNILACVREFTDDGTLTAELMDVAEPDLRDAGYFNVIVQLFIYGDDCSLRDRIDDVFRSACERIVAADELTFNSELTHLLLDLLACPHIDATKRGELLMGVWPILNRRNSAIGTINKETACKITREMEKTHWFVRWKGIGLLKMIEKKKLGTVYA